MEKNRTELEKLLPDDEFNKGSSNRFQVCKSEHAEDEDVEARPDKSASEPPQPRNGNAIERKMSSNGRFMDSLTVPVSIPYGQRPRRVSWLVSTGGEETNGASNQNSNDADTEDNSDNEQLSSSVPTAARSKGVHFSVGDKEEKKREHSEHNSTLNMKSWRNMKTIEHPPIMDFYRNSVDVEFGAVRPSMTQLIHGDKAVPQDMAIEDFKIHNDELVEGKGNDTHPKVEKFVPPQTQARVKFGWIKGVFVRCLLNIFGVMLYLRISWVAGQAGIGLGMLVVLLASVVTTITALSTCAICTNGDVKGGGAYFLISRSLGPEFGGSIGLIFSVANAVGAAMYVVGFAETIRDVLGNNDIVIMDGSLWDVRVVGFVTCCLLMGIVFIGAEFESKMQMGLLGILILSMVNYVVGSVIPPNEQMIKKGITGYSWTTMTDNMLPDFRDGEDFFSVFSVYFPAATGIMAGANISGDLADPQQAIPMGTILAIVVTTVIYMITVLLTGSTCVRDADGIGYPQWNGSRFVEPACAQNGTCPYGLMNYFQVMELQSFWGPLITAGIIAATLSSALASLVSAPKVFQAVCKDRLFPKIGYFAKAYGKDEEPRRAYMLAFIIAMVMIGIGDLNAIAPIISNFFLASYALINYACFDQSFADSPGFRPGFKYYNMWVSLMGSVLCVVVMFIISWVTALITFFCFGALFMYILHRKPDVNWGSSTQAHSYKSALAGMIKLSNTEDHVKNYRPQFLVLCGNPAARPLLVDFANNITKGSSLMICGYVVPYKPSDRVYSVIRKLDRQLNEWLRKRKVKSFYASVANPSLRSGAQSLLQVVGLGRLKPNLLLIGFKSNWYFGGPSEERLFELNDYFGTIQDAFDSNMGVCLLRNGNMGLDFSESMKMLNVGETSKLNLPDVSKRSTNKPMHNNTTNEFYCSKPQDPAEIAKNETDKTDNNLESSASLAENFPYEDEEDENETANDEEGDEEEEDKSTEDEVDAEGRPHVHDDMKRNSHNAFNSVLRRRNSRRPTMEQKALLTSISRFQRKVKRGIIDVWWLYDDGGLTLLIPHLLTIPKSYLEGSRLRVFTISTSTTTMEQEQRGMAALLSKFRIDFSDVNVIADIGRKPRQETMEQWEKLINPWVAADGECPTGMTTKSELDAQKEKTNRQLRAAELLQEHSIGADLIVMTLPVPRKGLVSPALYLSWLDVMTRGLPPTLLVRGNQQSVLTFYS